MAKKAHTTPTTATPDQRTSATSRRALFAGGAALAATGLIAAAPIGGTSPDAELIAIGQEAIPLAAECERHTAAFFSLPAGHPDLRRVAELGDPAASRLDELVERGMALRAQTLDGCITKARLLQYELRTHNRMDGELVFMTTEAKLAWSLVNDLLASAAS